MNKYLSGTKAKDIPDGYYWAIYETGATEIVKVYDGDIYDCTTGQYDAESEIIKYIQFIEGPIVYEKNV